MGSVNVSRQPQLDERGFETMRSDRHTGTNSPGAVVITGASTGIGYHTARALSQRGFRVFGTVRRSDDKDRLQAAGVTPLTLDVTNRATIDAAASAVQRELSGAPLVALVNNAGIPCAGPIEFVRVDDVQEAFDVNVFGVIRVTQAFLPLLRKAKGRIVNISSVSGTVAHPLIGPYAATKFALEAISDSLRRELVLAGVRVIVIQPGSAKTPIWDKVAAIDVPAAHGTEYEAVMERVRDRVVSTGKRGIPPEQVAKTVLRAITSSNPPTRIRVVRSRFKTWIARVLPDKVLDRMVARQLWSSRDVSRDVTRPS